MDNVLIIGYGASGKACKEHLEYLGHKVFIYDDKDVKQKGQVSSHDIESLKIDLAILSPGVSFKHSVCQSLVQRNIKITPESDWALSFCPQRKIAITGTNGKTTVTYLCEHILNKAGILAYACGNVAKDKSFASMIGKCEQASVLVCEVSSFQLERMKNTHFLTACVLNVTPDHLDRYESMDQYAKAKFNLQYLSEALYVYEETFNFFSHLLDKNVHLFNEKDFFMDLDSFAFHDKVNIVAAFNLLKPFSIDPEVFKEAVNSFKKPSFRFEKVAEISGISFINDSKATNVDATIQALKSLDKKTHLLAGGFDKGYPYTLWIPYLKNVKKVYCFGQAKEKIAHDISGQCEMVVIDTMQEAIDKAFHEAKEDEIVLLSPGCSSFDAFIDYVDRGKKFNEYVMNLKPKGE
jgi:UDP-N-acetylmuramoylalanine--D-glutamate ligase